MRRFTGFFNIPIIAVVLVGFFNRQVGATPAKIVLISHVIVYSLLVFVLDVDKRYGFHFIHLMGTLFVLEVALMLFLSRRFARETPYSPTPRAHGDTTPWRYASSMSTFLIAFLVSVYLTFSPLGLANANGPGAAYGKLMAAVWCVAIVLAWRFAGRSNASARAARTA
jgi:SSS family solute:Na+ symporter